MPQRSGILDFGFPSLCTRWHGGGWSSSGYHYRGISPRPVLPYRVIPNTWKTSEMKTTIGQRERWSGSDAMVFVECLEVSNEDKMEGSLWRGTLERSLGSHDAVEPVGGICNGNGFREETTRLHAISCTKTGWSSLSHNRVPHHTVARSLRESKVQTTIEDI